MEHQTKLQRLRNIIDNLEKIWDEVEKNDSTSKQAERFQKFKRKIYQYKNYVDYIGRFVTRSRECEGRYSNQSVSKKPEEKIEEIKSAITDGFQQLGSSLIITKEKVNDIVGEYSEDLDTEYKTIEPKITIPELTSYALRISPHLQQPRKWNSGPVDDLYFPNMEGPSFLRSYYNYEGRCKMPTIEINNNSEFRFVVENQCYVRYTMNGTYPTRFLGELYIPGEVIPIRKKCTLLAVAFKVNQSESEILKKTFTKINNGVLAPSRPEGSFLNESLHNQRDLFGFNATAYLNLTPQYAGQTPQYPGQTPLHPGYTPQHPGYTPQNPGYTPQYHGQTPHYGQTPQHYGQMTPRD